MAGRPPKHNADYFTHDAGMRNDPKIKALRSKFGMTGYATFSMLLEFLTNCDFFEYDINDEINIILLAGDFGLEEKELTEMIDFMSKIKLIQVDSGVLFCQKLKDRFAPLMEKRNRDKVKTATKRAKNPISDNDNSIVADDNTQSKVKYSKEEKSTHKKEGVSDLEKPKNIELLGFLGYVKYWYPQRYPEYPLNDESIKSLELKIKTTLKNLKKSKGGGDFRVSDNDVKKEFVRIMNNLPDFMEEDGRKGIRYLSNHFDRYYPQTFSRKKKKAKIGTVDNPINTYRK